MKATRGEGDEVVWFLRTMQNDYDGEVVSVLLLPEQDVEEDEIVEGDLDEDLSRR